MNANDRKTAGGPGSPRADTPGHRFPLLWPERPPRTKAADRVPHSFEVTTGGTPARPVNEQEAFGRLYYQLVRLKAEDWWITSNCPLRADGWPSAAARRALDDPGCAVWFRLGKRPMVLACDRHRLLAGNAAAIAAHIDALRRIERYGVGTRDQLFTGFLAIEGPGRPRGWRAVMGYAEGARPAPFDIEARYRELAMIRHPDMVDGSAERMAELNVARDEAIKEMRR